MSILYEHTMPRILEELYASDETVMVILKGHLLVEEHLNRILSTQLSRPEEIDKAGLKFSQRLQLVKALATIEFADFPAWDLISSLNSLRNQLAHSLSTDARTTKIRAFLERGLVLDRTPEGTAMIREAPEHIAISRVIGLCLGLLAAYEEEVSGVTSDQNATREREGA